MDDEGVDDVDLRPFFPPELGPLADWHTDIHTNRETDRETDKRQTYRHSG